MSETNARPEALVDAILAESDTEPRPPRVLDTPPAEPPRSEGAAAVARVVALFGERTDDEDADRTQDEEAVRLLLALDRPARPPAPVPAQRPSSDGGAFVAYSARVRPAARYAAPPRAANVIVDDAAQAAEPRHPVHLAELEAPTVYRPRAQAHPRAPAWIFVASTGGVLALGVLGISVQRGPRGAEASAPSVCVPAAIDRSSAEPRAGAADRLPAPAVPSTSASSPLPVAPPARRTARPVGRAAAHGTTVAPTDSAPGDGPGQFFADP